MPRKDKDEHKPDKPHDGVVVDGRPPEPEPVVVADRVRCIKTIAVDVTAAPGKTTTHQVTLDSDTLNYLFVACSKTCDVTIGDTTHECDWSQPIEWIRGAEPLFSGTIDGLTVRVPEEAVKDVVCSVRAEYFEEPE